MNDPNNFNQPPNQNQNPAWFDRQQAHTQQSQLEHQNRMLAQQQIMMQQQAMLQQQAIMHQQGNGMTEMGGEVPHRMKIPKKTKPNVENLLIEQLQPRVKLSFYRYKDRPKAYRHACRDAGVTILNPVMTPYYDGSPIEVAGCAACGKVFYFTDSD